MQRPTCTGLRIRSTRDAHKIFFAIRQGLLHLVTRRLDTEERQALRSGCVYAWEERGPNAEVTGLGIERFTEGRRWSPSRVRDEFLFYYEKWAPPALDLGQPGQQQKEPPADWDPLVKQTYSVYVETEKGRRKWHLTAYFTQSTVDRLDTVDDIPDVANVDVPDGMFKSTRTTTRIIRSGRDDGRLNDVLKPAFGGGPSHRTFAAYPQTHRVNNTSYEVPHPLPYTNNQHSRRYLDDRQPTHSLSSPYTYHPVRESPYSSHATSRPWENTPMGLPPGPGYNPWHHPSPIEGPERSSEHYQTSPKPTRATLSRLQTSPPYTRAPVASSSSHLVLAPIYAPAYPPQDRLPSIQHQALWPNSSLPDGIVTDPRVTPPPRRMSVSSSASASTSSRSEGGRAEREGTMLVPLKSLLRNHPYRRDPMDDKVLRRFDPRASTT